MNSTGTAVQFHHSKNCSHGALNTVKTNKSKYLELIYMLCGYGPALTDSSASEYRYILYIATNWLCIMALMRNIFGKIWWACWGFFGVFFFLHSGCHTSQIYASLSPSCGEKSSLQLAFIDDFWKINTEDMLCCSSVKYKLQPFALCARHYDTNPKIKYKQSDSNP